MKLSTTALLAPVLLLLASYANATLPEWQYENDCYQQEENCFTEVYVFEGENIALMFDQAYYNSRSFDENTIRDMLSRLDDAWSEYQTVTNRTPTEFIIYTTSGGKNLAPIVVLPYAKMICNGLGCGYVGNTGIEIASDWFEQEIYNDYAAENKLNTVLFYEMGRNYFVYNNLKPIRNDGEELGMETGFSVFMREVIAERINSPLRDENIATLNQIREMFPIYLNDNTLDWETTFLNGNYPTNGTGYTPDNNAMVASMLHYLKDQLGSEFESNFFRFANNRGEGQPQNDLFYSVFFKSASDAVNRNLAQEFTSWKLPLPDGAETYLPRSETHNIVQNAYFDGTWLYAQWDRLDANNMFNITINSMDQSFATAVSGADDTAGLYYRYFHKDELCSAFGTDANHQIESISIELSEDPTQNGSFNINGELVCVTEPSCTEHTDTLANHATANRVRAEESTSCVWGNFWCTTTTTYFAIGSDENLGTNGNATVTLREQPAGYFDTNSCPIGPDTTAPVIELQGDNPLTLAVDNNFIDPGVTASDNVDGDISHLVVVTGSVDTSMIGEYQLKYNVSDAAGNAAIEVTRTVIVEEKPACTAFTDTNTNHAAAGRAVEQYGILYYAVGSNEYLGLGSSTTTLVETSPGVFAQGNCN